MKFADIKQLTRGANYRVTVDWKYLEESLASYQEKGIQGYVFDMNPEFQRGHRWTEEQQRRYVEFILRGGQSSREIQWNCAGWMGSFKGPMYLVDGKQRMEAVRKFMRSELAVFDGNFYKDFTDNIRSQHAHFFFNVNDLKTYAEVLQWYIDLNTGGTPHTEEEISKVKDILSKERIIK